MSAAAIHTNTNASFQPEVEWFLRGKSWVWTSLRRGRFVPSFRRRNVVEDTNELVQRLSTSAGIIMEDSSPDAVSRLSTDPVEVEARLAELEQAMRDAATLLQAAQVLARRNIC
jgi:ketosteroid isomerase-like protein